MSKDGHMDAHIVERNQHHVTSDVLFDAGDAYFAHMLHERLRGHDEQRLGRPRQGRNCRFD